MNLDLEKNVNFNMIAKKHWKWTPKMEFKPPIFVHHSVFLHKYNSLPRSFVDLKHKPCTFVVRQNDQLQFRCFLRIYQERN